MSRTLLPPKYAGESKAYFFDFLSEMVPTEVILGDTCTMALYSGTDANPPAMINGVATHDGTIVRQNVAGGGVGNIYVITCIVTTNFGQTLQKHGFIAVLPNQP
jgi:hypothetical protein